MSIRHALGLLATGITPVGEPVENVDEEMPRGAKPGEIPAIHDPSFDDGRWLDSEDEVLGVEIGGDARAYPLRVLDKHEIVNEEIAGVPVAVTFCPLCGSARVFDRRVGDRTLTFEVSGRLYRNDLVMVDEETDSLWPQISAKCLHGELVGTELSLRPASVVPWRVWRRTHPDTRVLARPDIYRDRVYASRSHDDYEQRPGAVFDRVNADPRVGAKAWVYGVKRGDDALAIRMDDLEAVGATIETVDGEDVLLAYASERPVAWWLDEIEVEIEDGKVKDRKGQLLDPLSGEIGDRQLHWAEGLACYWIAWAEFAPQTRIWHEG